MKIEPVAQDKIHITCACGYNKYMAPSCRCCPDTIPTSCPKCGALPEA